MASTGTSTATIRRGRRFRRQRQDIVELARRPVHLGVAGGILFGALGFLERLH
ncbi:hypothetical protein [Duganella sp. Leaf61]|uniref:hypothetical protein n=1 Tax=Duganella sp. Leaf61 TaxID=1736227 RepID=UPI0012E2F1EE|nr:hypothetical protein [Duganella sp. Leaf61]